MDELGFQSVEEALHRSIVIAVGLAHTALHSGLAHGHCDISISRGDGLPGLIPEDVGICFRISPSELPLWTGYHSMQCFPDLMASFTDPVDKPGLGLPSGSRAVPISHPWVDWTPIR